MLDAVCPACCSKVYDQLCERRMTGWMQTNPDKHQGYKSKLDIPRRLHLMYVHICELPSAHS